MKLYVRNSLLMWIVWSLVIFLFVGCGQKSGEKGELERIYRDYHKALQEEDIDALNDLLAADRRGELLGEGAETKIRMIKGFLPTDIKVLSAETSGTSAVLKVEGQIQGQKTTGEVKFVTERGKWKITKEDWTMSLEMGEETSTGFKLEAKPFMKDPKQPPQAFRILAGHQGEVTGLAFSADGRSLVSASYGDYSLRVWDLGTGEELSNARTPNRVRSLALSPDGYNILTADVYNNVLLWPLEEGIIGAPKTIIKEAGDKLAVSPDGKYIVTTAYQKPLQLWNFADGSLVRKLTSETNLRTVVFSGSGKFLANGSQENTYTLWDTKKWKDKTYTISKVAETSDVSAIDFSRDDRFLATGHMDSSIVIFDLRKRREMHNFYVPEASTWDVKFSPAGDLLATAQQDKTVYLWEVKTARRLAKLQKHSEAVRCLAFSPDGTTLASGGEDRKIILWRSGVGEAEAAQGSTTAQPTTPGTGNPETMELAGRKSLIKNPYANQDLQFWQTKGDVKVEEDDEGNPFFVIRYSGMIWQDVSLPANSAGRWALLISWSSSERINDDGDQTGLPYLYGYMLNRKDSNRINAYLSGQNLLHSVQEPDEWDLIWGVFQIPPDTGGIRLFLQQADGGYAQNGSAARFDDPGIFLFDTEGEAKKFVEAYE